MSAQVRLEILKNDFKGNKSNILYVYTKKYN